MTPAPAGRVGEMIATATGVADQISLKGHDHANL